MRRIIVSANTLVLALIIIVAVFADAGTRVAGMSGVVFSLYVAILSAAALALNIVLSIIFFMLKKNRLAQGFLVSTLLFAAGLAIAYMPRAILR